MVSGSYVDVRYTRSLKNLRESLTSSSGSKDKAAGGGVNQQIYSF
jgi:hypothetical protein